MLLLSEQLRTMSGVCEGFKSMVLFFVNWYNANIIVLCGLIDTPCSVRATKLSVLCLSFWNSVCIGDITSRIESTAPELLPLWLRHGHQVPEGLAVDLDFAEVSVASP